MKGFMALAGTITRFVHRHGTASQHTPFDISNTFINLLRDPGDSCRTERWTR
jgi:hypothetical protein